MFEYELLEKIDAITNALLAVEEAVNGLQSMRNYSDELITLQSEKIDRLTREKDAQRKEKNRLKAEIRSLKRRDADC